MVNMKLSEEKQKDMKSETALGGADYPYGLQITLDNDSLLKLGIEELPDITSSIVIHAIAKVTAISINKNEKENKQVALQITDMEIGGIKKDDRMENKFYKKEDSSDGRPKNYIEGF